MPNQDALEPRRHVAARFLYGNTPATRIVRTLAVLVTIAFGIVSMRLPLESLLPQHAFRKDFVQEYILARAIAERADPYVPIAQLVEEYMGSVPLPVFAHPSPHPPTVGLLFLPLTRLDYLTAARVWLVLEILLLTASVYLLARIVGARLPLWASLGAVVALVPWRPVQSELVLGQVMSPMLVLLIGSWLALRSGRWVLGGALAGLAILIKPVPWPLLLLFVLTQDWLALAGAVTVIAGGGLASGCLIGFDRLVDYVTRVLPLVSQGYRAHAWNTSLASLGWRIFDGTGSDMLGGLTALPLVRSAAGAQVLSLALPALAIVLACLAVRRQHHLDVSWSIMVSVCLFTNPISWNHYILLAAMPIAHVLRWLRCHRFPSRETNWALLVTMLLTVECGSLANWLAGSQSAVSGQLPVPWWVAQLPFMPAVGVAALALLVARLGPVGASARGNGDGPDR